MEALLKLMEDVKMETTVKYTRAFDEAISNPTSAIKKARDGCIPSCMALCQAFRTQRISTDALPEALEMFATHIANGCPPEKVDIYKFQLAEISFSALASTFVVLLPNMKNPPLEPVLQAWPSILEWAIARLIHNVRADDRLSSDPDETPVLLAMFLDGIQILRQCKDLQIAANDPRVLELAIHLHLAPDADYIPRRISMAIFVLYIETSITRTQAPMGLRYKMVLDELLSAARGEPELLLNPILALLSKPDRHDAPVFTVLLACIQALASLSAIRTHPIAVTLEKTGLTTMSKVLRLLVDLTPRKHCTDQFVDAFSLCMGLFTMFSTPEIGRTWLSEALQYRIFHSMAICSPLFSKLPGERLSALRSFLSTNLSSHLIEPSIIFACERALSTLSSEHHEQIMRSVLAPAWKTFIRRFFEQYIFYCYFEAAGYHRGCYKCAGTAKSTPSAVLRRCKACKKVEYCSEECQMSNWKEHMKECKVLKDEKYGPLPRWAIPLFKRRVAAHDMRRHLPGIRVLAAKEYPCFPLQCICTRVHYGYFPPRIRVILTCKVLIDYVQLAKEASDPLLLDLCLDDIRMHDDSRGTLEMSEFAGRKVMTKFQLVHWSPPYFSSKFGSSCPDTHLRSSLVTPYVDEEEQELAMTWSVVDEIAYRGKLSPQLIFDGKMGEIRRKVLEVVLREKARIGLFNL